MNTKQKGFTLIELLVVIAIIGLLSTMAVVSLNSARAKARDAKRLSDVKQMANILSIQATEGTSAAALTGCTGAYADVITCTGPGEVSQFSKFLDASTPGTPCGATPTATCQYSIVAAASTVESATIKFYLESASGGIAAGAHTIDANGVIN
ncbi:MAG: type II secretion system protein [Patescibacteria group bacterium]